MLRSLDDALDTLKESGARFYTITGRDLQLSHESDQSADDPSYSVDAAQEQFTKHWQRLSGGSVYRVNYRVRAAARTKTDCFTVLKPTEQTTETAPQVGGFGGVGYNEELQNLRDEVNRLRLTNAVREANEPLIRKLELMEREKEQGFDASKIMGIIAQIGSLTDNLVKLNVQPQAGVSAARAPRQNSPHTGAGSHRAETNARETSTYEGNDEQQRGANALARMQASFGDNETFVAALEKLAGFVENDPEGAKNTLNYL